MCARICPGVRAPSRRVKLGERIGRPAHGFAAAIGERRNGVAQQLARGIRIGSFLQGTAIYFADSGLMPNSMCNRTDSTHTGPRS